MSIKFRSMSRKYDDFIDFREESKQDSDMDEPWIMTVKGPHGVKGSVVPMLPLDEQPASLTITHTPNHRSTNHNQQTKPHANGASRSPPKDSTLNHYRSESRDSVRDGQAKHTPVSVLCFMKLQSNPIAERRASDELKNEEEERLIDELRRTRNISSCDARRSRLDR